MQQRTWFTASLVFEFLFIGFFMGLMHHFLFAKDRGLEATLLYGIGAGLGSALALAYHIKRGAMFKRPRTLAGIAIATVWMLGYGFIAGSVVVLAVDPYMGIWAIGIDIMVIMFIIRRFTAAIGEYKLPVTS